LSLGGSEPKATAAAAAAASTAPCSRASIPARCAADASTALRAASTGAGPRR
jgi:hypothetical protein